MNQQIALESQFKSNKKSKQMAKNRLSNSIEVLVQKHSSKYFEENVIYQYGFEEFMRHIGVFKKK